MTDEVPVQFSGHILAADKVSICDQHFSSPTHFVRRAPAVRISVSQAFCLTLSHLSPHSKQIPLANRQLAGRQIVIATKS